MTKKIQKGFVYVVKDIDINGKCNHGFVSLKDVLVDEKTTVRDLIARIALLEKRNVQIEQAINRKLAEIAELVNNNQQITNAAIKELADELSKGRF